MNRYRPLSVAKTEFAFPIPALLREGDAIVAITENHPKPDRIKEKRSIAES
jgi:hypothetical protein